MEHLIEIGTYDGADCRPVVAYEGWRVAFLNYAERFDRAHMAYLEKHELTDEVFVLLCGEAVLYLADGDEPKEIHAVRMEPYKTYNVKKGVWHNVEVTRDTRLLIVENRNTSRENTKYYPLSAGMLP